MKKINSLQLLSILRNTTETSVRIVNTSESVINYKKLEREIKTRKALGVSVPDFLDEIEKIHNIVATVNGVYEIGKTSYEEKVNNALRAKGLKEEFKAKPMPYGDWIVDNSAMEHSGNGYLRGYFTANEMPVVSVSFGDEPISTDLLKLLNGYNGIGFGNKRQEKCGLAPTECINIRVIPLDSIQQITIGNEVYELK